MTIKLQQGQGASREAILELEAALDCRLSDSFRNFVRTHDGAKPEDNVFRISDNNSSGINRFIPVAEIRKERAKIENLPNRAYPIAWDASGNYVLIDEDRNGAVFFWDHELPSKPTDLAANFASFLDLLEPFDTRKIQLKASQVEKAWVDPEFLRKLKK